MSTDAYTLVGLTLVLGALISVVGYAVIRFASAARTARGKKPPSSMEGALIASAIQESVSRLRDQGREMQARAEASERLSEEIVSHMSSGMLLIEAGGHVRLVNPAGRRLLNLKREASGNYHDLLADIPTLRQVIDDALEDGRPIRRRMIPARLGNDVTKTLGITVTPVTGTDGELQSVVCIFTDVTEVMVLEEQLRFKDSLARLGELSAGIAHEFRNGLATIHGYARLMNPERLPAPDSTYLKGIRDETETLTQVVSNFLSFARSVPLSVATVDLRALVHRVGEEIRHDLEERGGRLAVEGTFCEIEGDEVLLRQAIINLCRNASEACSAVTRAPMISITGDVSSARTCRIVVADNGPGIEAAVIGRIFQPFFTTRSKGTGLGLALVQKTIVIHNGRITASNRENGGAAFEVILPLQQGPRAV